MALRVIFMGSPAFAVPSLEGVRAAGHEVPFVVTQPDKRRGRGQSGQSVPVRLAAQAAGIPVMDAGDVRTPEGMARLGEARPDVIMTVAFGEILRPGMLALPRLGCFNAHASLLPRFRGAAPIQWCLMEGEQETGVCVFRMTPRMDDGDVIVARRLPILQEDNGGSHFEKLSVLAACAVAEALQLLEEGRAVYQPQDHARATYARKIMPGDRLVRWNEPAARLVGLVRAFAPVPGAWTTYRARRLILLEASAAASHPVDALPGQVVSIEEGGVMVAAGHGSILLHRVKWEGRVAMDIAEFLRGARMQPGDMLGTDMITAQAESL